MTLKFRKKKSDPKLRTSARAEAYFPVLLDKLAGIGAFDQSGRLIYPVIEDFFFKECTDYRWYRNKHTGEIVESGGNLTGRLLSHALLRDDDTNLKPGQIAPRQRATWLKRWEDTTPELQAVAILFGLKVQNKPHRQICFHIGEKLVVEAIRAEQPLAAFIVRRLRERLPSLLGDTEFGLWFCVEQVPFEANSIHAHGLIYVNDVNWLTDNLRKNECLRELIRLETGDDGSARNNWLSLRKLNMDAGNIWYSTKASENRMRSRHPSAAPIEQTGSRLEARSHTMSRIGKEFYMRVRPFLNAAMTNRILDWDEGDWNAVGAVGDDIVDIF